MSTSAFRNIGVVLSAQVNPYVAGMAKASTATRGLATEINKAESAGKFSYDKLGKAGMVAGGVMLAGFGLAARAGMEFQSVMSEVQAVSGATAAEFDQLSEAAVRLGGSTSFTATEVAKAEAELAKAGVSTSDILGGALAGSLAMAAAGQIDVAKSAEFAANAMNIFELKGGDVGHIADVLSAAANKSAADIEDMGMALSQGGLVARQMGMGLEETAGALAAFAQNGLKGSDAGTSLKTMLLSLNPKSKEAADLMRQLGIDFSDGAGGFVDMAGVAGVLEDRLGGLTEQQRLSAMFTIFGTDAIRAANVLYEEGATGIRGWTEKVDDAGNASETARIKTDNLKGDLEKLGGAWDSLVIKASTGGTGALRGITQGLTNVLGAVGALPEPLAAAGFGLAGVGGAITLAAGAATVAVPKYQEMLSTVTAMGPRGATAAKGITAMSRAAGFGSVAVLGLAVAYGVWAEKMAEADAESEKVTAGINERFKSDTNEGNEARIGRIKDQVRQLREEAESIVNPFDIDKKYELLNFAEDLQRTALAQEALLASDKVYAAQQGITVEELRRRRTAEEEKTAAIAAAGGEEAYAIQQAEEHAKAQKEVADALDDAKTAFIGFWDELAGRRETQQDWEQSVRDTWDAYNELTEGGGSAMNWMTGELNTTTEAGRNLRDSFEALADDGIAKVDQALKDGDLATAKTEFDNVKTAVTNMATQMGLSETATTTLLTQLGLTDRQWTLAVDSSQVDAALWKTWNLQQRMEFLVGKYGLGNMQAAAAAGGVPATNFPGNARGGHAWAGATRWVGEAGPELVRFNTGAQIYDTNTSARMLGGGSVGGGGNHTYHVTVNVPPGMYDEKALADRIGRRLRDQGRGQG